MFSIRSITQGLNPVWLLAVGLAALLALAVTTGTSEASDEFGDSASSSGTVADEGNATGANDGAVASLAPGATVTVVFDDNIAYNGAGDDILLYFDDIDGTAGGTVALSSDGGSSWGPSSVLDDSGNVSLDIGSLALGEFTFVNAVRISNTDASNDLDLDAVEATNGILLDSLTIELDPPEAVNDINSSHEVTATVNDGSPVEGVELTWQITAGPNADVPSTDLTDGAGQSSFNYLGDDGAGTDEIVAFLDFDGDGTPDEGEPAGTATKRWLGVTGTIDLIDIDGGMVALGDVLTVRVEDSDLDLTDGIDHVDVTVSTDLDGGSQFTLELTETGAQTGVFEGSIFLAAATDATAFELGAIVGSIITASYDDELDDDGNDPDPVTEMLTVTAETDAAGDKVTICHVPPGNPENQRTLSVGAPAREAHLAHGDSLGECGAVDLENIEPKHDFCEKRSDHPRCDKEQLEVDASASHEDADDGDRPSGAAAFCERRPDHRKCTDAGDGLQANDAGDDEDDDDLGG